MKKYVLLALASSVFLAACSGDGSSTTTSMASMDSMDDHSEFAFGEPATAAEADRTIEIIAGDNLRFDPEEMTVAIGEVITFRIVNEGQIPHDFTLGDEATQEEHEEEMAEMEGMTMPDEPNAIAIEAGETRELTWRFAEAGTVLIGCHQPGHYAAGMIAEITVEE